jgi:hypothetical protein
MRVPRHEVLTSVGAAVLMAIMVGSGVAFSFSSPSSSVTSTSSTPAAGSSSEVPFSGSDAPSSIAYGPFAAGATTPSTASGALAPLGTGVIVPLFTENSGARLSDVNEIIQTKLAYPVVPIVVVFNPEGGPGSSYDPGIATEVRNMQSAGITVVGYVPTGWGEDSISSVESAMLVYLNWYGVSGIYLDQMPNWNYNSPSGTWYYSGPDGEFIPAYFAALSQYGKSIGMTDVMANSGADVPTDFIGSVNTIGIFENSYLPSLSLSAGWTSIAGLGGWHASYTKSNFMFFSYGVPSLDPSYLLSVSDYVGYLYITNGTGTQPYNALSPYFDQMVSLLASKIPVTIQSETMNGISTSGGLWVTVAQPDGSSSSGYTPSTFDVSSGSAVTVSADSYGSYVFDHWSDGSRSPVIEVTPTQAMTLVAFYR